MILKTGSFTISLQSAVFNHKTIQLTQQNKEKDSNRPVIVSHNVTLLLFMQFSHLFWSAVVE